MPRANNPDHAIQSAYEALLCAVMDTGDTGYMPRILVGTIMGPQGRETVEVGNTGKSWRLYIDSHVTASYYYTLGDAANAAQLRMGNA